MTTSENQKFNYILKRAAIFFTTLFFSMPLIDLIGGDSFSEIIENKSANPLKFVLITAFQFASGLLIGWLGWKQKQDTKG